MEIAITKMSSKGQVVIPAEMRVGIGQGEKLVILRNEGQLIMKKASDMDKSLKEELEFARRTEDAWKRYGKGKFKSASADDFLKVLSKC